MITFSIERDNGDKRNQEKQSDELNPEGKRQLRQKTPQQQECAQ